jgi:hypothetical protein
MAAQDVGFLSPELQLEQSSIDRKRKIAEALLAQSQQTPQGQMAGRFYVAPSPLQGIAKAFQAYAGLKGQERADEDSRTVGRRGAEALQAALAESLKLGQGTPGQTIQPDEQGMGMSPMQIPSVPGDFGAAYGRLAQAGPAAMQLGAPMIGSMQRQQENQETRAARIQDRVMQLEAAAQNAALGREAQERARQEAAALRREMQQGQQSFAQQQAEANRAFQSQMAADARANRQAPAPEPLEKIQTPEGPRLVPRSQAVGQRPAMAPDERRVMQADEKATARAQAAVSRADLVIGKIDEAMQKSGFFSTGATGAVLGAVPGTGAYDLGKTIDTIKANIGFQELQAMREASPTGGALGQVAVQELNMLQAVLSNLDKNQSQEQLENNLAQARKHFENWRNVMQQQAQGGTSEPATPSGDRRGSDRDAVNEALRKYGKPQ